MERLTIDVGAIVQHFHRNKWLASATEEEREKAPYTYLYRIESVAYWQENVRGCGLMVVYRALYNDSNDIKMTNLISGHDMKKILKYLGQASTYQLPTFKTQHSNTVEPADYHQFFRYMVEISKNDKEKINQCETSLKNVAKWIGETLNE